MPSAPIAVIARVVCCYTDGMDAPKLVIELEREDDDRWIAEVPSLPGVMVYGQTRDGPASRRSRFVSPRFR